MLHTCNATTYPLVALLLYAEWPAAQHSGWMTIPKDAASLAAQTPRNGSNLVCVGCGSDMKSSRNSWAGQDNGAEA